MEHDVIPLGERHGPHNFEYADETARTSAVITDAKWLQSLALQLDDGSYWRLTAVDPAVWVSSLAGTAGGVLSGTFPNPGFAEAMATQAELDAHINDTDNPHEVTKAQVGLGNVDNTSDVNKPVSTAQAAADAAVLAASAPIAHVGSGGTSHANVIAGGAAGFMSGSDKTKLDGIASGANNYSHPANHPPSIITQDSSNRFVTDAEKATWNAKQPAGTYATGGGTATGTNTGDQTSVTGNAGTATALQTARTIGGSSFNGTANVTSFPSPGAIGGTTPSTGAFTTVTASGRGTFTNGLRAGGTATLAASGEPGLQSYETTTSRFYIGDGTGYTYAFSKRSSSVTTDIFTINDSTNAASFLGALSASNLSGTHTGSSSGTNTGDQTTITGNAGTATALATGRTIDGVTFNGTADITVIAPGTVAATAKTTPVDADVMPLADSAASNVLKKVTWANIKATLKAYFDTLYAGIPQNSQSTAYTLVLSDAGKHILHPSADTTARTFTIPANASVAFPVNTAVTFVNQNAGGVITIAITTDTMRLAGAGTTGSRTLAANGVATALKITSTEWIISGVGLS